MTPNECAEKIVVAMDYSTKPLIMSDIKRVILPILEEFAHEQGGVKAGFSLWDRWEMFWGYPK